MAAFYGDSSALAKRYIREAGSGWKRSLTDPAAGNRIYTAQVTGVEIVAAVARRVRTGSMTASDATSAITTLRHQFRARFRIVPLTDDVVERAMDIAEHHGLRGYDAIQLACALTAQGELTISGAEPIRFLSADADLNTAAGAEGLTVEDPNTHQ
jgi:predicted nucleic acid-binding protein